MIVVFGSINVDFVTSVPHVPGVGETVLGPTYAIYPGGKGANQALAARRAGADVKMVGAVGNDGVAANALELLVREGVDVSDVARVDATTGAAFICVDAAGGNAIVVASGANAHARGEQLAGHPFTGADILILQREICDAENAAAARLARRRGARVLLNLAPGGAVAETVLQNVDLLVMNEGEAALLAQALGIGGASVAAILDLVCSRYGVTAIATLGSAGALARAFRKPTRTSAETTATAEDPAPEASGGAAGQAFWHVRPPPVEVVDTTAAGDAFVGALAAALDAGRPLEAALREAVAAGSLACTRAGAQPSLPDRAAILAAAPNTSVIAGDG